ncbi:MAG TPA: DUF1360 domain-containing protein [Solirubrobacteraceae bacterium]|nr:DUF1360 domain-containing protein [Solirubrobacteraceae bacterium]
MAATETRQPPARGGAAAQGRGERPAGRATPPLAAYGSFIALFGTLAAGFAAWLWRSGRTLPERLDTRDLLLVSIAAHKLARLITKDRVTSAVRAPFTSFEHDAGPAEVEERARGRGLRRALGEVLTCPYCLDLWISAAFTAGFVVAPRAARWSASAVSALFGADVLQIAYKRLEDTL